MRKKFFFFFSMALCLSSAVQAQNIIADGTVWTYSTDRSDDWQFSLESVGEKFGKECLGFFGSYDAEHNRKELYDIIHVDGDKVFLLKSENVDEWLLMYDFGLQVGEKCTVYKPMNTPMADNRQYDSSEVECVSIGSQDVFDVDGKVLNLVEENVGSQTRRDITWIAGFGSMQGFYLNIAGTYDIYSDWQLKSIFYDGKMLYDNTELKIESPDSVADSSVTLDGRRLTVANGLTATVYATDGRCVGTVSGGNDLTLPAAGVYVVKTPGSVAKVLAR